MNTTTIARQPSGIPVGGQFASHDRADSTIELTLPAGGQLAPLSSGDVIQITTDYLDRIDNLMGDAAVATTLVEDGHLHGRRHAYAEIVTRLLNPQLENDDEIESAAEDLLNDRYIGARLEDSENFGPAAISATDRAKLVDSLARRADDLFVFGEDNSLPADVQAHFFGQFETLSEASLSVSDFQ